MFHTRTLVGALLLALCLVPTLSEVPAAAEDLLEPAPASLQGMEWRCVGPHVGNRGCTVAMHPTDKNKFFHGHSSGGLWMTEDAGQYWIPISDKDFNVGSIGAMAGSEISQFKSFAAVTERHRICKSFCRSDDVNIFRRVFMRNDIGHVAEKRSA